MSTDPLQRIPCDQWHKLKSVFLSDWPRSITGRTILETQEDIIKRGYNYGFKVYCPYGDVNKGMVAVNKKDALNEIIIQHAKDDTDDLEFALLNSEVIDWSGNYSLPDVPQHISECVQRVIQKRKLKFEYIFTSETFLLYKCTPFKIKLPASLSFEQLSLSHIKLIDSVWPHRYLGSEWYFELLTKAKLGYGLFINEELISWAYLNEKGAIGHLYTMEIHRRKGYGELLLKVFSNMLMEQGRIVFAFCIVGNTEAHALYKKLGFDNVQNVKNFKILGK